MAKQVLSGVRIFSGGADLTTRSNKVELASECEDKDSTAWTEDGTLWKEILPGLFSSTISAGGQWEAGDASKVDDALWSSLGGLGGFTVCPNSPVAAGDLSYFTYAQHGSYKLGDAVGEVAPWEAKLTGSWPMVRGLIAHPPGTARTTTGNGTAVQHVAVPAGKRLYASLHVLSASGTTPSLTVKVQSDDNSGFTTAADRITFTAATDRGSQVSRTAVGANTDTYYRAQWTISGTSPSFLFVVAFGVAP